MFIPLEQPFQAADTRWYEVHATPNDVGEIQFVTLLYPATYQMHDWKPQTDTDNPQNWPDLYHLGWTKTELFNGIKDDWTPSGQRWRDILIDSYETKLDIHSTDDIATDFFDFSEWSALPTPDVFDTWLPTLMDEWNHSPSTPEKPERLEAILDQLHILLYTPDNVAWDKAGESLRHTPFTQWIHNQILVSLAGIDEPSWDTTTLVHHVYEDVHKKFWAICATNDTLNSFATHHTSEYHEFILSQKSISNRDFPDFTNDLRSAIDTWMSSRIGQALYHCTLIERHATSGENITWDKTTLDTLTAQLEKEYKWALHEQSATKYGEYWDRISTELHQIKTNQPTTTRDVITILNEIDPHHTLSRSSEHSFFGGSGRDDTLADALTTAGWTITASSASYHYIAENPTSGDLLYYVEGDVYGDTIARQKMANLDSMSLVSTPEEAIDAIPFGTAIAAHSAALTPIVAKAFEYSPEKGGYVKILTDATIRNQVAISQHHHPELWTQPDLILGTQPSCGKCGFVRRWLDNHGLTYKEINLTAPENRTWVDKLRESGLAQQTPVLYDPASGTPLMSGSPDMRRLSQIASRKHPDHHTRRR